MTFPRASEEESLALDTCSACGEQAFDWPRCRKCGSVALDYLHDKVKRDLKREKFEWHVSDDGKSGRIAA